MSNESKDKDSDCDVVFDLSSSQLEHESLVILFQNTFIFNHKCIA